MIEELFQLAVTGLSGLEATAGVPVGVLVAGALAVSLFGLKRTLVLGGLGGLALFVTPYLSG